jgi:outer membrane protein
VKGQQARFKWWLAFGAACALSTGVIAAGAAQTVKIGVVDIQQVLNQSQRGIGFKQKLEQERATRQRELDAKQQELTTLQAEFEKQAPLLSETAKREKQEALQRRIRDARRLLEDANRDFEKKVRDAEAEVTREIMVVVQELGKDQGFAMIMEKSSLLFTGPAVDITPDVIKRYDAKQK